MARINVSNTPGSDRWDIPEVEILRGIELPKMSPRRTHAVLQGEISAILRAWAAEMSSEPSGGSTCLCPVGNAHRSYRMLRTRARQRFVPCFADGATFAHNAAPGLRFDVSEYFDRAIFPLADPPRD